MIMEERQPIRSVCVLGGGIVAFSAALAFARALPKARVELVETPPDPAALADRMPGTLPSVKAFHRLVGINEADLLREAGATHRVAIRFDGWSPGGAPWFHTLGLKGPQVRTSPFHLQWLRAEAAGQALPFHLYSPAGPLAQAEKFFHPDKDETSILSRFDYALRLDPELYRRLLARRAQAAGVKARSGTLAGFERREDGGLGAILLDDGARIEADLFLDCAGPSAPLLSAVSGEFEDWSEYLPCDRLLLSEGAGPPSPVDQAAATATGWRFASPGLTRTVTGTAFSSDFDQPEAAGEFVSLRPGRRPEPWVRNVVAFGDAAVAIDPLEWTNLHLAQSAIMRALTLLPGRDCHPLVLREYNSLTGFETGRARDFVALHYLESQRRDGALWKSMPERRRPDSLAHTLEQFRERGRLPHHEEESYPEESWLAVLIGLGIRPRRVAATATTVDLADSLATMARVIELTAPLPAQLPPYPAYLEEIKALRR